MRTLVFALVIACPPFLKAHILRWFCGAKIGRYVYIGWFSTVMGRNIELDDHAEIRSVTIIRCDGEVRIGAYSVISNFVLVYGSASFIVGNHCYIGPQCLINADEDVRVGNVSAIGPRSMLFTHGSFLPYTEGYWVKFGGITIGDHVWIAAGVFIHPGIAVGNNVFVNSRSVLKEDIPAGKIVEGFPAKRMSDMEKVRRNMTPTRVDATVRQMLNHFAEIVLRRAMAIEVRAESGNRLNFQYRHEEYALLFISSAGPVPFNSDIEGGKHLIFLVNRPYWQPPSALKDPLIFDFTTMRTHRSRDRVHAELWQFMRKYFGVTFEYQ
jgi:acetyltransferase-like isoleucine patch superfamily enzyme